MLLLSWRAAIFLPSPARLRARALEDGYLFFRDLVSNDSILRLRGDVTRILCDVGWLPDGTDHMDAISTVEAKLSGTPEFIPIYDTIQWLESFHTMAHNPELLAVAERLFGEPKMPHPSTIARVMLPGRLDVTTPPHQDFVLVQGKPEVWTCWVPLVALPHAMGGLVVVRGSHLRRAALLRGERRRWAEH